jgi:hypothetical protein
MRQLKKKKKLAPPTRRLRLLDCQLALSCAKALQEKFSRSQSAMLSGKYGWEGFKITMKPNLLGFLVETDSFKDLTVEVLAPARDHSKDQAHSRLKTS